MPPPPAKNADRITVKAVLVAGAAIGSVLLSGVRADVVRLAGGARVTGTAPREQPRNVFTIELEGGGRLTLDRDQVRAFESESAALTEYRKRAPTAPDTVESQFALARWCLERRLNNEYRRHLERVVQLDPEHEEARSLLGYQRQAGRWLTREQLMSARGMVRHEGGYRTRQEIALLERARAAKEGAADWKNRLERWRRNLASRDAERRSEAAGRFASLDDRGAAPVLATMLLDETDPATKLLLVDCAARIRTGATVTALTKLALEDPDEETRYVCLEHLTRARTTGLAEPFVRALKHKNNTIVNRAAAALQEIGGSETVGPLITALVTTHKFKVGQDTGGGQRFDITSGGGGFSFGGGGAKVVTQELRNPQVLSALVHLTGENFAYDKERWRDWIASQQSAAPVDLRRDN